MTWESRPGASQHSPVGIAQQPFELLITEVPDSTRFAAVFTDTRYFMPNYDRHYADQYRRNGHRKLGREALAAVPILLNNPKRTDDLLSSAALQTVEANAVAQEHGL